MTENRLEQLEKIRQSILSGNYQIICDETNNTQEDIENGVMNVAIDWCVEENVPGGKNV